MSEAFCLSQNFDVKPLHNIFHTTGRVEIPEFITSALADKLRDSLLRRDDWTLVLNAGEKVYEIERRQLAHMNKDQLDELDRRVIGAGQAGFQYRYEAIRTPDDEAARLQRDTLLDEFVRFMSSIEVVEFLSAIIGNDRIQFADGQATAYSQGHFLTRHDDDVAGKHRHAAYVLGLSPNWRAEWGGLLMFHGKDGNIEQAFAPAMGALRLFAVPQPHSVSYVTPMAPEPRLSVTGWLRSHSA